MEEVTSQAPNPNELTCCGWGLAVKQYIIKNIYNTNHYKVHSSDEDQHINTHVNWKKTFFLTTNIDLLKDKAKAHSIKKKPTDFIDYFYQYAYNSVGIKGTKISKKKHTHTMLNNNKKENN